MQRTFIEVQDIAKAETQAVMTFLVCSLVGVLYIRAVTSQRTDRD
jgi:hypothetical protein